MNIVVFVVGQDKGYEDINQKHPPEKGTRIDLGTKRELLHLRKELRLFTDTAQHISQTLHSSDHKKWVELAES